MRISDWSSDVCSSDLPGHHVSPGTRLAIVAHPARRIVKYWLSIESVKILKAIDFVPVPRCLRGQGQDFGQIYVEVERQNRSEARRVGKECERTCRSWWSASPYKKKKK